MTEKVTGDWRQLDNEKRHDLYCVTKYYLGDQTKMNERGRACSKCVCVWGGEREREREVHTAVFFWDGEDLRKWDLLEVLSVDGTVI